MTLFEQIEGTVEAIRNRVGDAPQIGVILGTGLGGLGEKIEQAQAIPYRRCGSSSK